MYRKERSYLRALSLFTIISLFLVPALWSVSGQVKLKDQRQPPDQTQKPGQQKPEDDPGIRLDANLVVLYVNVVDRNNTPINGLRKDQFQVYEDKILQSIQDVTQEEVPVSVGLVIDTSGSMRRKLQQVIDATVNFVKQSRAEDEFFVVDFKDPESISLIEDFTTNTNDVADALKDMIASGGTALFDALTVSAEHANKNGKHRRKALVVITDGVEKDSFYRKDEVIEKLREADVQLYLVGFTADLDKDSGLFRRSEKAQAEKLLKEVADDTGGRSFFPTDLSQMKQIADQIAHDLRTQYAIAYYPTNEKRDGTFRRVQVRILDNRNLVARTRTGYHAPKEGGPSTVSNQ